MNGAVQGEATTTASTPDRKSLATGLRACRLATLDGTICPTSNTPARFSPIRVNSSASPATTAGDCSWKPQPSWVPAARRPSIRPPSSRKDSTTPAV